MIHIKKIGFCLSALYLLHGNVLGAVIETKTLANGLKVIVYEKPDNDYVELEVWYRAGSKDEKPGIRGMAHLFEHMMFRGTAKYPGDAVFKTFDKVGGSYNAYTTYDRTVYHEYIPVSALDLAMDVEADRMNNLKVTQEILNTERQVVGEEYRNGRNNWYQKMNSDRYESLYPAGHPYAVDVIGHLEEITSFTAPQCMNFYNSYYSPNNAFVVVVGNVKAADVFAKAEKYFGSIQKQLPASQPRTIPDLTGNKIKMHDMSIDFPVQIYSFVYPRPDVSSPDFLAMKIITDMVFSSSVSVMNKRLVKKEHSAYIITSANDEWSLYPNLGIIDVLMPANPGNVKVKRAIREELNKVIADGISQEEIDKYLATAESSEILELYTSQNIGAKLGQAEYYLHDYNKAFDIVKQMRKVTPAQLKEVAAKYFSEDKMEMINVKPE